MCNVINTYSSGQPVRWRRVQIQSKRVPALTANKQNQSRRPGPQCLVTLDEKNILLKRTDTQQVIRIALPKLTAPQATLLYDVVSAFEALLWDIYEPQLLAQIHAEVDLNSSEEPPPDFDEEDDESQYIPF